MHVNRSLSPYGFACRPRNAGGLIGGDGAHHLFVGEVEERVMSVGAEQCRRVGILRLDVPDTVHCQLTIDVLIPSLDRHAVNAISTTSAFEAPARLPRRASRRHTRSSPIGLLEGRDRSLHRAVPPSGEGDIYSDCDRDVDSRAPVKRGVCHSRGLQPPMTRVRSRGAKASPTIRSTPSTAGRPEPPTPTKSSRLLRSTRSDRRCRNTRGATASGVGRNRR